MIKTIIIRFRFRMEDGGLKIEDRGLEDWRRKKKTLLFCVVVVVVVGRVDQLLIVVT